MSRIDGIDGQWVLAGEPIGHMGPDNAVDRSIKKPKLHVELRRHGEPINPMPWLTANKGKVTG
jgi:septal ring factor EnvC (AmiA/AmiB activator)